VAWKQVGTLDGRKWMDRQAWLAAGTAGKRLKLIGVTYSACSDTVERRLEKGDHGPFYLDINRRAIAVNKLRLQ